VWEVIEAAATKPFGFMKFTPGPGLGGHCIPVAALPFLEAEISPLHRAVYRSCLGNQHQYAALYRSTHPGCIKFAEEEFKRLSSIGFGSGLQTRH
ncbi:MAG TPA: hypothetical protein PKX76_05160, partial [Flexilinea sp.]|nr:hypothetical protein [Flexilinea sp.]